MIKIKKKILIFLIILSVIISGCTMPPSKTGVARGTGYPEPYCGDGKINQPSEECDGSDLGGKTCQDFGNYTEGILSCTGACEFDFAQCRAVIEIAPDTFEVNASARPRPELTSSAKVECFPKGWIFVSASHGGELIGGGCPECGPDFECIQWIAMRDPALAAMTGFSTEDTEVSYIVIETNENEAFSGQEITLQGCGDGFCDNGSLKDAVGNNDGTIYGDASFTAGKIGEALHFDGDDYVSFGAILNNEIKDEFTIGLWTKLDSGALEQKYNYIFWKEDDRPGIRVQRNGQVNFINYHRGDGCCLLSNTILQEGTWYYLTYVFNGSDFKGYIDGQYEVSIPNTAGYSPGGRVNIGSDAEQDLSRRFHGLIDEVRIYKRALSDSEILTLYNEVTPLQRGLVAYYKFDREDCSTCEADCGSC